jgi:hypothetical protein
LIRTTLVATRRVSEILGLKKEGADPRRRAPAIWRGLQPSALERAVGSIASPTGLAADCGGTAKRVAEGHARRTQTPALP